MKIGKFSRLIDTLIKFRGKKLRPLSIEVTRRTNKVWTRQHRVVVPYSGPHCVNSVERLWSINTPDGLHSHAIQTDASTAQTTSGRYCDTIRRMRCEPKPVFGPQLHPNRFLTNVETQKNAEKWKISTQFLVPDFLSYLLVKEFVRSENAYGLTCFGASAIVAGTIFYADHLRRACGRCSVESALTTRAASAPVRVWESASTRVCDRSLRARHAFACTQGAFVLHSLQPHDRLTKLS